MNDMKVLITGAKGMLGWTLLEELKGFELIPTDMEVDITDAGQVDAALALHRPDCVIHCAAMTAWTCVRRKRNLPSVSMP